MEKAHSKSRAASIVMTPLRASFTGNALQKYHFGFKGLLAALIWIDLLQRHSEDRIEDGKVSWEYSQLAALLSLDPHFMSAYEFGAVYLSVLRRDNLGAKLILERWVNKRPHHWRPTYLLGYHLFYEMDDYEEASAELLKAASMEGAPFWLSSLGIRLLTEAAGNTQALRLSTQLYGKLQDRQAQIRLRGRIRSLVFHVQEATWKEALTRFKSDRGRYPGSTDELRTYFVGQMRQLASMFDGQSVHEELIPILNHKYSFRYSSDQKSVVSERTLEELGIERVDIYETPEKSGG